MGWTHLFLNLKEIEDFSQAENKIIIMYLNMFNLQLIN